MKNFLKTLALMIITIFSVLRAEQGNGKVAEGTLYADYVEAYAHELGYYDLFNSLRMRVAEFIRKLDFRIRKYILDLRFDNKQLQADAASYDLRTMLENLETAFDAYFQSFDIAFLVIANNMNKNDNTPQEKKLFLMREKNRISESVEKMIRESSVRFAQALT